MAQRKSLKEHTVFQKPWVVCSHKAQQVVLRIQQSLEAVHVKCVPTGVFPVALRLNTIDLGMEKTNG